MDCSKLVWKRREAEKETKAESGYAMAFVAPSRLYLIQKTWHLASRDLQAISAAELGEDKKRARDIDRYERGRRREKAWLWSGESRNARASSLVVALSFGEIH